MVSASLRLKQPPWEHLQSRGPGLAWRAAAEPEAAGGPRRQGRPWEARGLSEQKCPDPSLLTLPSVLHTYALYTRVHPHTHMITQGMCAHTLHKHVHSGLHVYADTQAHHAHARTHTCTRVGTSADQAPLSRQHMVQRLTAQFCQLGTIRVGSLSSVKCCRI